MLGAVEKPVPMGGPGDRRSSDRFPIERTVRYKVSDKNGMEVGTGQTVNISSTGVLFIAEGPLPTGRRIEVSISWPAQLDGKCNLKLVARGRVVRSKGTQVAIEIEKYEFRTAGTLALGAHSSI